MRSNILYFCWHHRGPWPTAAAPCPVHCFRTYSLLYSLYVLSFWSLIQMVTNPHVHSTPFVLNPIVYVPMYLCGLAPWSHAMHQETRPARPHASLLCGFRRCQRGCDQGVAEVCQECELMQPYACSCNVVEGDWGVGSILGLLRNSSEIMDAG